MANIQSNILLRIKNIVAERDSTAKVILYGSRARGNARNDSDWDILILINQEKITAELESEFTNPLYELEFDSGQIISPMIYSEYEWNNKYRFTSFFKNVMREGKVI